MNSRFIETVIDLRTYSELQDCLESFDNIGFILIQSVQSSNDSLVQTLQMIFSCTKLNRYLAITGSLFL